MVSYPEINLLSIIIGYIVSSVLGFLWYDARTPMGALYMKEMGYEAENLEVNNLHFGIDFAARLFMVWGVAILIGVSGADDFMEGLTMGLFAWFAFIVTSHWAQVAFEQRKQKVYYIYVGYQLVVFVILGPLFALT
ncbi:MAG: DUF1761 domain-containing protein [Candidatus Kariarchaeaceae archaeon]|jgi:hypothetical protein